MNNLLTRILVAVIFIPFILYLSYFGGIPFMSFVNLLILLGLIEFSSILKLKDISFSQTLLIFFGLLIGVSGYYYSDRFILIITLLSVLISGLFQLIRYKFDNAIENLSSFLCGLIYGGVLAAFVSKSIFFKEIPLIHLLSLAILISVFGQLGDFVESSFKRQVSLKDSSSIIPGHGGILDRFDSLLFSAPLVYFYLTFILYR